MRALEQLVQNLGERRVRMHIELDVLQEHTHDSAQRSLGGELLTVSEEYASAWLFGPSACQQDAL